MKMIAILAFVMTMLTTTMSFAGVQIYNGSSDLGLVSKVKCTSTGGLTCTKVSGALNLQLATSQQDAAARTHYGFGWLPTAATDATSTTPATTTVYLSQIRVPEALTLTGAAVLNGATVGTDKYVVALFNSAGTALAHSALAGTTTSGASVYQPLDFTATVDVSPGTYWVGLYVNGTTDRFYSVPTIGQAGGLAGSATGQTFGTVANVTVPTTFTADKGPVAYVY